MQLDTDAWSLLLLGATLGFAAGISLLLLLSPRMRGAVAAASSFAPFSSSSPATSSSSSSPAPALPTRRSDVPLWRPPQVVDGLAGCIGNTPLIYLRTLSEATGCTILGKAEFLNPGGSSKDRIARQIVLEAQRRGRLPPGGTIVEGTSGSTGISLSLMAAATGCGCDITMPDDQAMEKSDLLSLFGAGVERVRPAAISNDKHYCNIAERRAAEITGGFYADQFENLSNVEAHRRTTGVEIWRQTGGAVDAFVMSAGTGGTITGVGSYLQERKPGVGVYLADPTGSVLYHRVKDGVAYAPQQAERTMRRVRIDTITEGIGIDRLVRNFTEHEGCITDALRVDDQDAVNMAWHLLRHEGLFVGSSSGLNCSAAVRVARRLGPGHTVVTVLCDSGQRHLTKLYNLDFLKQWDIVPRIEDALNPEDNDYDAEPVVQSRLSRF